MFPCLAQTLPSSKLTQSLSLSLSCHSGSMSREQSRDRWRRTKLGVFNEGPAGTTSGKTPRPVESKTAAVLKCKPGRTQQPCSLCFSRPLWQICASQLGSRKLEQTTASVWVEHKAHYCSTSVFETFATPPEKQTTTKDTIYPTFTSKKHFIPGQKRGQCWYLWEG